MGGLDENRREKNANVIFTYTSHFKGWLDYVCRFSRIRGLKGTASGSATKKNMIHGVYCGFRIQDPDLYHPEPRVLKAPDPGFLSATLHRINSLTPKAVTQ
jgi:hypothetical protein